MSRVIVVRLTPYLKGILWPLLGFINHPVFTMLRPLSQAHVIYVRLVLPTPYEAQVRWGYLGTFCRSLPIITTSSVPSELPNRSVSEFLLPFRLLLVLMILGFQPKSFSQSTVVGLNLYSWSFLAVLSGFLPDQTLLKRSFSWLTIGSYSRDSYL